MEKAKGLLSRAPIVERRRRIVGGRQPNPYPNTGSRTTNPSVVTLPPTCPRSAFAGAPGPLRRPVDGKRSETSSAQCRQACRPRAASSPSVRSPRSRQFSANRASDRCRPNPGSPTRPTSGVTGRGKSLAIYRGQVPLQGRLLIVQRTPYNQVVSVQDPALVYAGSCTPHDGS